MESKKPIRGNRAKYLGSKPTPDKLKQWEDEHGNLLMQIGDKFFRLYGIEYNEKEGWKNPAAAKEYPYLLDFRGSIVKIIQGPEPVTDSMPEIDPSDLPTE